MLAELVLALYSKVSRLTFDDWVGAFAAVDSFNSSDSRQGMLLSSLLSLSFLLLLCLPLSLSFFAFLALKM